MHHTPLDVQESLLTHLSDSQQQRLTEARQRRDDLQAKRAAAQNDLKEANNLVEMAHRDYTALRARLGSAGEQIDYSREFRTNDALDDAQQHRDQIEDAVRLASAQLNYNEGLRTLAQSRIELLDKQIALADARYELAKAKAVHSLDRPAAEKVDVDTHRYAVEELADSVEAARIDALVARRRVELTEKFVAENADHVPEALRLRGIEPVQKVFDSDAFEEHRVELDGDEVAPMPASAKARNADTERNDGPNGGSGNPDR